MKYAIVTNPDAKGTETEQTWWLLDCKEGEILHDALSAYCDARKSNKRAKKLLSELDMAPNHY